MYGSGCMNRLLKLSEYCSVYYRIDDNKYIPIQIDFLNGSFSIVDSRHKFCSLNEMLMAYYRKVINYNNYVIKLDPNKLTLSVKLPYI